MQHPVVNRLYEVFEDYRLTDSFRICDLAELTDDEMERFRGPLNRLTVRDLNGFAFSALTTWGNVSHFKHFLPRLFELALESPESFDSIEVLFGKLPYAQWTRWPEVEQEVVNEFLIVFWESAITSPMTDGIGDVTDDVLCAIGNTGVDLFPFLESWAASSHPSAHEHFAAFADCNPNMLNDPGTLSNAFWQGCPEQERFVVNWMKSMPTRIV